MFFIMPTLTARSIAKGLGGNEIRVLLSYPVKRWETLLSKVSTVFIPTFVIFAVTYLFNAFYMYQLSPLNDLPYSFMISLFLPTLFITALSFGISFLTKDELKTVLLSLFTLLFLEFTSDRIAAPFRYMSTSSIGTLINEYLISVSYGRLTNFLQDYTIADVQVALVFPILTSTILLAASFVYFQLRLDID
jgi:ABC-type transport system involved in multi-copper enzyme maturation permease subunit